MQPITQSIFANNNLAIRVTPGSWQLAVQTTPAEAIDLAELTPLVEATAAGLNYQANFAQARNLPGDLLSNQQVETVVVGWERKDGCWHLGVLFSPDLAEARGERWCGLARWLDPTGLLEFQAAETAGRTLADTLHRPFRLVTDQLRPELSSDPVSQAPDSYIASVDNLLPTSTAGASEPLTLVETEARLESPRLGGIVLADPPVLMGDWMLMENENGLIWKHSHAWRTGMIIRLAFFTGLALLFIVLSIGGLSSIFAPVQPDWLPLVGLGVSVVLLINAGIHVVRLYTAKTVEFDKRLQMVRWQQPSQGVVRQVPFEKVQYILSSHSILRAERLKGTTPVEAFDQLNLEVWLHVARDIGDFVEFGHVAPIEGRGVHYAEHQTRHPLDLTEIDSPIHHAAQLIAAAINVPAFVEHRT